MGVGHSIVSELNFDGLKINHPTPCAIVQPLTGGDVLWYVVYRFVMASYIVGSFLYGIIVISSEKTDYLVTLHFPVWGYCAANIQAVLMAYCTLENYYSFYKTMSEAAPKHKERHHRRISQNRRKKFSVSLPKMPKTYIVILVSHYIMLYSSLITLLMYTTGLYKGRLHNATPGSITHTPIQVILHEVFFAYCILDFCVCGIPVRLLHFYVMTIYAIFYQLTLLVVTIIFSKKVENYRPVYDVADFQAHRVTICAVYFVSFAFIAPVAVHVIYYALFLLKSYLTELYFRTTRVITKPKQPATATPEEKGAAGATEWASGTLRSKKITPISEHEETEMV